MYVCRWHLSSTRDNLNVHPKLERAENFKHETYVCISEILFAFQKSCMFIRTFWYISKDSRGILEALDVFSKSYTIVYEILEGGCA